MTRKMNRLTDPQKFRLAEWTQSVWDAVKEKRPKPAAVAKAATKELGFVVTEANMESAAAMFGEDWPQQPRPLAIDKRVDLLRRAIAQFVTYQLVPREAFSDPVAEYLGLPPEVDRGEAERVNDNEDALDDVEHPLLSNQNAKTTGEGVLAGADGQREPAEHGKAEAGVPA